MKQEELKEVGIDFEQELYKAFGQVKDFTLGMRIARHFFELGLREQNRWKPSDEQMEYLAKAITTLGDEGNCKTASILNDLRVELKKLRGE